jgi:hypothetical protein
VLYYFASEFDVSLAIKRMQGYANEKIVLWNVAELSKLQRNLRKVL